MALPLPWAIQATNQTHTSDVSVLDLALFTHYPATPETLAHHKYICRFPTTTDHIICIIYVHGFFFMLPLYGGTMIISREGTHLHYTKPIVSGGEVLVFNKELSYRLSDTDWVDEITKISNWTQSEAKVMPRYPLLTREETVDETKYQAILSNPRSTESEIVEALMWFHGMHMFLKCYLLFAQWFLHAIINLEFSSITQLISRLPFFQDASCCPSFTKPGLSRECKYFCVETILYFAHNLRHGNLRGIKYALKSIQEFDVGQLIQPLDYVINDTAVAEWVLKIINSRSDEKYVINRPDEFADFCQQHFIELVTTYQITGYRNFIVSSTRFYLSLFEFATHLNINHEEINIEYHVYLNHRSISQEYAERSRLQTHRQVLQTTEQRNSFEELVKSFLDILPALPSDLEDDESEDEI